MYCPGDGQSWGMLMPGDRSHRTARRSGSGYGRGFSSSALTTLKIAVLAPIPIARDATITNVTPGVRLKVRRAYRRSCRNAAMCVRLRVDGRAGRRRLFLLLTNGTPPRLSRRAVIAVAGAVRIRLRDLGLIHGLHQGPDLLRTHRHPYERAKFEHRAAEQRAQALVHRHWSLQ